MYALKRAALLIQEIAGGVISSDIVDIYPTPYTPTSIELSFEYIDGIIGKKIPRETIETILLALDITILTQTETHLSVRIPSYRIDVKQPADVVEEILRI